MRVLEEKMQTKRIRTLHIIIILLLVITIISLTFAGVLGALYVRETREVSRLQREGGQMALDQALPVLSVDVEEGTGDNQEPGMEDAESANGVAAAGEDVRLDLDDAGIAALM